MKKLPSSFVLIIALLVMSSFTFLSSKDDSIPEEFNAPKTTLLIEIFNNDCLQYLHMSAEDSARLAAKLAAKGVQMGDYELKIMKEAAAKKYPYPYEFASKEAIKSDPKYADKDKYRYVLAGHEVPLEYVNGGFANCAVSFKISDRKLDKEYPQLDGGSFVKNVFGKCLDRLVEYTKKR